MDGINRLIDCQHVISGNVDFQKFKLSGFRLFGNDVLNYFYKGEKLDLYPNLFKFTHLSAHWYKSGFEYTLDAPLLLSPHGSYISNTHGKNIEFRPVKSLNIEQHISEQRELREEVGRVFYHEVEGATLELPVDEFLLQLRVAVPELTTMLNFLVTGDITVFENSDSTDNLLLSLYAQLEETGLL